MEGMREMDEREEYCTVVTGAAGGIGFAVASRLLAAGERVVAADLDADRLAERFAGREGVVTVACDLAADAGLQALTDAVAGRFAGARGFVHAAGFDIMAPLGMTTPDDMQRLFSIHAVFPVRFMGWMAKMRNHAPDASCVLISSLSAHEGAKGHVAYAAAKGAVEGLLKPAAAELVERGVRLNAVVLGVVETGMSRRWMDMLLPARREELERGYPLGLGRAGDAAEAVCFLLSPASRWITGQTLVCDGGHSL